MVDTIYGVVERDGTIISGSSFFEVYKVDQYSFRVVFKQPFEEPAAITATLYSKEINNAYYETSQYSKESQGCIVSGLEGSPLTVDGFSIFYSEDVGFCFTATGNFYR